jgi:two-component system response regulator
MAHETGDTTRILIVEDSASDEYLLRAAFGELEPEVDIRVAKDGAECLDILLGQASDDWHPRLILMDLNLPKVNGLDVLARIKNDPRTRCIPVIVLTSSRAKPDVLRAYASHANAYLSKPSTFDELSQAARNISSFWLGTAMLPD